MPPRSDRSWMTARNAHIGPDRTTMPHLVQTDLTSLVGQSIMLAFPDPVLTDEVRAAMAQIRPTGILFFAHNIVTREGVYQLCHDLQAEARRLGLPPLLIAADQEGGIVSRLPDPFVTVPSAMAQGATGDPESARVCARISGRQLREVGININFAPVLDVNNEPANPVIGTRSFGDSPDLVARFGIAAIRGSAEANVVATGKHFPGHGDTVVDSHLGLPVVNHPRDRLERIELAPFAAAVAAGIPAIMTAHIVFPVFDAAPATLSHAILTGLLREEMGFQGVIFTDAMNMEAITTTYGLGEAVIQAKAAGVDVLETNEPVADQLTRATALQQAAASGRLPRARFEATAGRLDALRTSHDITYDLPPRTASDITYNLPPLAELDPSLADEALAVARRAVTLLPGATELPLPAATRLAVIDCQSYRLSDAEDLTHRAETVRAGSLTAFPNATVVPLSPEPLQHELNAALDAAAGADVVLFITRVAGDGSSQLWLGQQLAAGAAPLIHAAVRSPYQAGILGGQVTTLLTYGDPPASLQGLIDVLAGATPATGQAPVRLASG